MSNENMAKHDRSQGKGELEIDRAPSNGEGEIHFTTAKSLVDNNIDEAAKYLAGERQYPPLTPEKEKRLRKKIDAWMIPLVSKDIICNCKIIPLIEIESSYFSLPLLELSTKWSYQPQRYMDSRPTTT